MIKKINITQMVLNTYLSLFIFSMINKEFLLFGMDLRFIMLPLGFILILINVISNKGKIHIRHDLNYKKFNYLIIFYIWVFISNISWIWNRLPMDQTKFVNEIILLINVFISVIVIYIYEERITPSYINKNVIFSCLILFMSMVLVSSGLDANAISMTPTEPYMYRTGHGVTHTNLFGWDFRPSGYASDPNYATLLLIIACFSVIKLNTKRILKILLLIPFIIAISMAFSKTTLLASAFAIIYVIFVKYIIKNKKMINIMNKLLLIVVIIISMSAPFISLLTEILPKTMTIRLIMWEEAMELFARSPIVGSGITSFRSYFSIEHWFVQTHSTYLQIISETGLIGIMLFYLVMTATLKNSMKDTRNFFIVVVFIIFMVNFETIALQFFIFVILLSQINEHKEKIDKERKALFMINSISNGGAERVCINMANELVKNNYKVDFILLGTNNSNNVLYELNDKIRVFDLNISTNNKIRKLIQILFSVRKINNYIEEEEKNGQYSLITSHLPMSNILTRVSSVKKRAIYVFHLNMSHYGDKNNFCFKVLLKFMFSNKKIVTVSEGVRQECIKDYNMNEKLMKTIYNPIDLNEIEQKMNEPIDIKEKFFLQVGRLSKQKRQDRMLEIFSKGEFFHDYKLAFCGTGDLLEEYRKKAKELGIENSVYFLGWQSNSYKWMKNAEILLCTSDNEAFPMTLIEALSCKTKVVSSNCKFGPNEILVNDFSNFLVEPDDIDGYISKINMALKSYPQEKNPVLEKCMVSNVIEEYLNFAMQN